VNRQGSQGILDGASNSILENEFGTRNEEDVVKQILEKGSMQETEVHIHSLIHPIWAFLPNTLSYY